jgi:hypothetical protein
MIYLGFFHLGGLWANIILINSPQYSLDPHTWEQVGV